MKKLINKLNDWLDNMFYILLGEYFPITLSLFLIIISILIIYGVFIK